MTKLHDNACIQNGKILKIFDPLTFRLSSTSQCTNPAETQTHSYYAEGDINAVHASVMEKKSGTLFWIEAQPAKHNTSHLTMGG
jgi:hypothetical protein